mgnify:CR=1 FL=1
MAEEGRPGCFTRVAEGGVGALLGAILCRFLLELREGTEPGCLDVLAYLTAAAMGSVVGFRLPEILAALKRRGVSEPRARTFAGLVAGSLVAAAYATIPWPGPEKFLIALCAGAFLYLFVVTVIGGSRPVPGAARRPTRRPRRRSVMSAPPPARSGPRRRN